MQNITMPLLLSLPAVIVAFGIIAAGVVLGALYLVGIIGKARDEKTKFKDDKQLAADNAVSFVINALKEQITVLEKKVREQEANLRDMNLKLATLSGENKNLKDLLLGKDEETKKFQNMGVEVMTKTVPILMETTTKTNQNVERLAKAIEKHLIQMERKQTVTVTTGGIPTTTT